MRLILLAAMCTALVACRAPYLNELADLTVVADDLPTYGTPVEALNTWFDENAYAPGPRVYQSESQLRRPPGTPLVYANVSDKEWWLSRSRTVRDLCVTQKFIYYKLDANQALERAVMTARSQC